LKLHRNKFL